MFPRALVPALCRDVTARDEGDDEVGGGGVAGLTLTRCRPGGGGSSRPVSPAGGGTPRDPGWAAGGPGHTAPASRHLRGGGQRSEVSRDTYNTGHRSQVTGHR